MAELLARRQLLLARCEAQRLEISWRLTQLNHGPLRWAGAAAGAVRPGGRHPLAWVAALAGLLLFRRPRRVLSVLEWLGAALAVASRAQQIVGGLRALRRKD